MSPTDPLRVLVVDDDFAVASVHRGYVETVPGFVVVGVAHRGLDALQAIEQVVPDLVLLDIYLPDISGLEVLRRLRADPGTHDVDVIAITASREVDTVRAAMSDRVVHYLVKPFTLAVFQARLQAYAEHRRQLHRLLLSGATLRDQAEVDHLLSPQGPRTAAPDLPKGLSTHTLDLVRHALQDAGAELSAGETAARCGLSRVSARRYLEYLSTHGQAEVRPRYGSAGRPEHGYRWLPLSR